MEDNRNKDVDREPCVTKCYLMGYLTINGNNNKKNRTWNPASPASTVSTGGEPAGTPYFLVRNTRTV